MPQQAEQREAFDNYVKLTYLALLQFVSVDVKCCDKSSIDQHFISLSLSLLSLNATCGESTAVEGQNTTTFKKTQ